MEDKPGTSASHKSTHCITQGIAFSTVSQLLAKIKVAKTPKLKLETLEKYINKFRDFRKTFQEKHKDADCSFYPIIRLMLPKIDRERESYGIQVATMGKLYSQVFGFNSNSREAKMLTTPQGFNASTADYADVVFNVIKDRCSRESTLTVFELNTYLDTIADPKTKGADMENIFSKIITATTALDQKWIVRIILKHLHLGIAERRIMGAYHPKAYSLYERMTFLSRVCERVETGRADEEEDTDVVALFQPLRSMLCEQARLSLLDELLRQHNLYVELKMDGERYQIHKQGTDYRYFSRNDEYTDKFGATASGKCYSASLHLKLDHTIKSVILDGEMMVWNQVEKRFLAKGENIDARNLKNMKNNVNLFPVFCAFDILFLNGQSLIKKPYEERIRLLDKLIEVDQHVIVICKREKVQSTANILQFFNRAIDDNEEGIILKGQDSIYRPGMRNGSGWFKLKPDYVDGLISDLDLLIMGATRNKKGFVESFIIGVGLKGRAENEGDPDENMVFHSVSMVRSGLTWAQWSDLNVTLSKHWVRTGFPPNYLDFGNCRPDCWILPRNSIILQVKATELNKTTTFRTAYTLRFPRITATRADKPWFDCCLLSEFEALVGAGTSNKVQKIAKRHANQADVSIAKKAKARKLIIQPDAMIDDEIIKLDNVCKGLEFCILSTSRGQPSTRELTNMVKRHGGVVVRNPGPTTFLCVAGDLIATVKSYAKTNLYDIVKVEWLVKMLGGESALIKLPPLKPFDMISIKGKTKKRFELEFDEYNDSYVHVIEDDEEMKTIFDSMELKCYERLLERELNTFEEEHILGDSHATLVNLFSNIYGFFWVGNHSQTIQMIFISRRGIVVPELVEATHVFVAKGEKGEEYDLPKDLKETVKVLSCDFIIESIREGRLLEQTPFIIPKTM